MVSLVRIFPHPLPPCMAVGVGDGVEAGVYEIANVRILEGGRDIFANGAPSSSLSFLFRNSLSD